MRHVLRQVLRERFRECSYIVFIAVDHQIERAITRRIIVCGIFKRCLTLSYIIDLSIELTFHADDCQGMVLCKTLCFQCIHQAIDVLIRLEKVRDNNIQLLIIGLFHDLLQARVLLVVECRLIRLQQPISAQRSKRIAEFNEIDLLILPRFLDTSLDSLDCLSVNRAICVVDVASHGHRAIQIDICINRFTLHESGVNITTRTISSLCWPVMTTSAKKQTSSQQWQQYRPDFHRSFLPGQNKTWESMRITSWHIGSHVT